MVDDGSTDSSPAIARRYADSDPARIRCLEHPGHRNAGAAKSRNLAVWHSRGEYIALLDADDIWLRDKLRQQVELMKAWPAAGMVYGHSIYFNDGGGPESERVPPLAPPGRLYRPPELLRAVYPLGSAGTPCPSEFLVRAELWKEVGGFEESLDPDNVYEDITFLSKVYLHAPVFVAAECWDRYRCHEQSWNARAQRDGGEYRSRESYLEWLQAYLRREGIHDVEIEAAIRRLMWPYRHPALARARRMIRGAARRVFRRNS